MSTAVDPNAQTTRVVAGEFFTDDEAGVRLRISECHDCASRWFPPVELCSRRAGTDLGDVDSGTAGVVYASTVVRVGPPGFPAPYVLSYVDIDGVRVLVHTEAETALPPDTPVQLVVGEIGLDGGTPLVSYKVRAVPDNVAAQVEGGQQ